MPTITTTTYPDEAYVRVNVDWTDQPDVTHARVIRTNTVTGDQQQLRPYGSYNANGDLLLTCGLGMWWDTEPPIGVPVQYRTEAADIPVNTVTNPSFEAGIAPWVGSGATIAASALFAHDGANSGQVTPTGGSFTATMIQTLVPVTGGEQATLSAWILAPLGWNSVQIALAWVTASGQTIGLVIFSDIEILDDAEWRLLTMDLDVPDNAATATIFFSASGFPTAGNVFYVDQFTLTQMQPVTAYALSALVTVTATFPFYLKDPIYPCNDRALTRCIPGPQTGCNPAAGMMVQSYGRPTETYNPASLTLLPVNRVDPVDVVRPRRDADTTLNIITRTFADRDLMKATLAKGGRLLFQAPPEYGIADRYIMVGPYTINMPAPDHRIQPRLFALPHGVRQRPAGAANGPCGTRVDDLCDLYSSWAAITIAGLTYSDLMLGEASPHGPGQPAISTLRTFDEVQAEFASFNAVNTGGRTFDGLLNGL